MKRINNIFNSSEISWGWDHSIERQRRELKISTINFPRAHSNSMDQNWMIRWSGGCLFRGVIKENNEEFLTPWSQRRDILRLRSTSANYYLQQNIFIFSQNFLHIFIFLFLISLKSYVGIYHMDFEIFGKSLNENKWRKSRANVNVKQNIISLLNLIFFMKIHFSFWYTSSYLRLRNERDRIIKMKKYYYH